MILKCELKNCYGIESFNQEFDFTTNKTFVIYASNGVMKTSFARTFAALQNGIKTKEEIHNKISTAIITINDVSISQEEIFVINPYIETYEFTNVSTLLVDECSKKEYETEINKILILKTSLLSKLNKISGIKVAELESLIMKDFDRDDNDDFFTFLLSQQNVDDANHFYIDVEYTSIFNDKVLALLNNPNLYPS